MLRRANPDSRIPTYLQYPTKENMVWQIKLTAVLLLWIWIKGEIEIRRTKKRYANC